MSDGVAEVIRAMPVTASVRRRAEQVLSQSNPSWSAKALAKDARLLCDAIDALANGVGR